MTEPAQTSLEPRAGLIALVGAPNVGKSTLINRLVGAKVAIVTPKAQTTRSRVLGIRVHGTSQVVFVDTPGIFQPKRRLDRAMVQTAWREAGDADIVCMLVDASKGMDAATRAVAERLRSAGREVVAVLNKIDRVKRPQLLELAQQVTEAVDCSDVFMIAAINGDGVDDMLAKLAGRLPQGPWLFPEDQLSDVPDRLMAAELTREKLMMAPLIAMTLILGVYPALLTDLIGPSVENLFPINDGVVCDAHPSARWSEADVVEGLLGARCRG